jgi:cytochrome c oxidase cbb3-type subunit III
MRLPTALVFIVTAQALSATGYLLAQAQGGRGNPAATFPAQQRPPGDPVLIERGKGLYTTTCSACHGPDLRGGTTGGPNLLRSQVVLSDQKGELILPIVHGSRAERGMPALPLPDADVIAIAEYLHAVVATSGNQGRPPEADLPPPNAVVGDAAAGAKAFAARCSSCHSPTGDLQGIGTRVPEGKALQNAWVTGVSASAGGRRGRGAPPPDPAKPDPRTITATVTLPTGERFQGPVVRIDNFLITIRQPDGSQRTFRRVGETPRVELKDPLAGHKALLPQLTDKEMHDVTAYLASLK